MSLDASARPARSHYRPRTPEGRRALGSFLALFVLCQPPVVHVVANRVDPWIGGLPFLYAWLLVVYLCLIGVQVWALRKGV